MVGITGADPGVDNQCGLLLGLTLGLASSGPSLCLGLLLGHSGLGFETMPEIWRDIQEFVIAMLVGIKRGGPSLSVGHIKEPLVVCRVSCGESHEFWPA
jgi:hypothetical protein